MPSKTRATYALRLWANSWHAPLMRLRADNPGKAFKLTRSLERALGLEQLQINSLPNFCCY
jgi:hypothetical protein